MARISATGILTRQHRHCSGFTLIELLVVIVLIGIVGGYLLLSISGGNETRELESRARQIRQHMISASHEAILSGYPVGLRLSSDKIEFLVLNKQGWSQAGNLNALQPLHIRPRWQLQLYDAQMQQVSLSRQSNTGGPHILFSPDGGSTAFTLTLGNSQTDKFQKISTDGAGQLQLGVFRAS